MNNIASKENMKKILFICHGNICRSPMAEFILKSKTKDCYVESAATSTEEIGSHIYPKACEQLVKHGIKNFENKRARQVKKSDYEEFDFLIIMDEENRYGLIKIVGEDKENKIHKLLDFSCDEKIKGQDVLDPWYTRDFDKAYEDIEKGCIGLIKYLKNN